MPAQYLQKPVNRQGLLSCQTLGWYHNTVFGGEQDADAPSADKGLAYLMQDYIDANYGYNITPKSVAEKFFVNPSYASRCFREKHHVTLTEYIHKVRIDRAKILLQSTGAPVGSIALNVGYIDANYFSRSFKKQTGLTPQQYREKA